jgi:hypothetical protein
MFGFSGMLAVLQWRQTMRSPVDGREYVPLTEKTIAIPVLTLDHSQQFSETLPPSESSVLVRLP